MTDAGGAVALNRQPLPPKGRLDVAALRETAIGAAATSAILAPAHEALQQTARRFDPADLIIENPTGTGVVHDIDFGVQEYVAPVVR